MQFYSSPAAEAQAIRRAVSRVPGCVVQSMSLDTRRTRAAATARVAGEVVCLDGWGGAALLLALAEEDARTPGARALAARIRREAPSDAAYAAAIHKYVKDRVRFTLEVGEIFQSGAYTLTYGYGDCDDHARLLYSLAVAGGLPAGMGILHHGDTVPREKQGPAHATAVVYPRDGDGRAVWAETTVNAHLGENPNTAARRLGVTTERSDIAKEVVIMSSSDLAPVPDHFLERSDPAQVSLDAAALQKLGYLDACATLTSDPTDPVLRAAVLAFQVAQGIHADGLLGDRETRPAIARALEDAGVADFDYTIHMGSMGAPAAAKITSLTAYLPDEFFAGVKALADYFAARGSTITGEDLLAIFQAESNTSAHVAFCTKEDKEAGRKGIDCSGAAGLNQIVNLAALGWKGTRKEYLSLSETAQLEWVRRYFDSVGKYPKIRNLSHLYTVQIAPSATGSPDSTVLYRRPSAEYTNNAGIDTADKGTITIADLAPFVLRATKGPNAPKWAEMQARMAAAGGGGVSSGAGIAGAVVAGGLVLAAVGALAWWRFA